MGGTSSKTKGIDQVTSQCRNRIFRIPAVKTRIPPFTLPPLKTSHKTSHKWRVAHNARMIQENSNHPTYNEQRGRRPHTATSPCSVSFEIRFSFSHFTNLRDWHETIDPSTDLSLASVVIFFRHGPRDWSVRRGLVEGLKILNTPEWWRMRRPEKGGQGKFEQRRKAGEMNGKDGSITNSWCLSIYIDHVATSLES